MPLELVPPNRTVTARAGAYASEWKSRADGPLTGRCVQLVPFHSQVSLRFGLPAFEPPNRTVTCRAESYAMPLPNRGGGPPARWVQAVPFHSHVSPLCPPAGPV